MKTRLLLLILAGAALLGVSSLGVACKSGGGAMTMEEYFQALQAIEREADERSAPLEAELDDALSEGASEEQVIAAFREFLDGAIPIFQDYMVGVESLEPPAELRALHDETLSSGRDLLQVFVDETADLGSDATIADIRAFGATLESDPAAQRFDDSCAALQDEADKREIAVDLDCEDEEG